MKFRTGDTVRNVGFLDGAGVPCEFLVYGEHYVVKRTFVYVAFGYTYNWVKLVG